MKRFVLFGIAIAVAMVGAARFAPPAVAQEVDLGSVLGVSMRNLDTLAEGIPGPHFRVGDTVVITDDLAGDVYVAGGTVRVQSTIEGDLLVAGGQVLINGDVTQDVRAVGGNVTINGVVGGNVSVAGGTVQFGPESVVNGSVVGGMGNAIFDGAIDGNAVLGAGTIDAAGVFGQDLLAEAGAVQLLEGSMVEGNLNVTVDEDSEVINNATVNGETTIDRREEPIADRVSEPTEAAIWSSAEVTGKLFKLLMALVSASILYFIFPGVAETSAAAIRKSPFAALGWGFAYLFLAPIAAILLMVTVLALPVGVMVALLYVADLIVAGWVTALAVGHTIDSTYKPAFMKKRPYVRLLTGIIALFVVGLIPVFGGIVKLIAVLLGMGGLMMWAQGYWATRNK